ncbi:hypothetical protein KKF91_15590, partial [Myxococcota bacterium]|nr:hypothetical protein [Myxococcota bacterium]
LNTDCGQGMACLTGRCIESPGPSVCDAPIIMDHIGDYQGVTDGASTLEGTCGGNGAEEAYFFMVGEPMRLCVTSSGYDTVLHARADCMNDGAEIACNDDSTPPGGFGSAIEIDAQPNVPYFIFVDSFNLGGAYTLSFNPCP